MRDGAGLAAIFATAPDLVVTNPKVLKKVFDKGFVAPEAFRTILVDGAEWHDVMGDTDLIASLVERFPAALQLIVTGPSSLRQPRTPTTPCCTPPPTAGRPTRRRVKPPPRNAWYSYPKRR